MLKLTATLSLALGAVLLVGCGEGVEGTGTVDIERIKQAFLTEEAEHTVSDIEYVWKDGDVKCTTQFDVQEGAGGTGFFYITAVIGSAPVEAADFDLDCTVSGSGLSHVYGVLPGPKSTSTNTKTKFSTAAGADLVWAVKLDGEFKRMNSHDRIQRAARNGLVELVDFGMQGYVKFSDSSVCRANP